ncbi:MAG: siderophore-interacting protein [Pseudonocardiales bacterium]|nr:siderophore-interacting protein [Pseudonocardiales bacterium]MBV9029809.1 siderophore-interacting protein [Pseudonocardiales bacterium]MBW0010679.1 siderophore-interacting protein [Pseudonocardiales bacterium]
MRPQAPARGRLAGTVATVAWTRRLTPRMTRVRLVGESLAGLAAVPGQTLKIYVPDLVSGCPVSRDYTVRGYTGHDQTGHDDDGAEPHLDIDFVLHGAGPAATWARRVRPGETLELVGPSGRYRPDPHADWHLFAGDETALPAIQAYAAMLPAGACALLYLEVADAAERQPIPGVARPTVCWLHRGDREPGTSTVLEDALRAVRLPPGRGRIWVAGHAPTVRRIRAHLLDECGIDRHALYVRAFWERRGR